MIRDRLTTLLIVAALVGLSVYVAFHTYWGEDTVATPMQGEAATNPYYSVERLLHAVGVQTRRIASLRELPPASEVLFVDDLRVDVAHIAQASLEQWVERGGRLIITGNIDWVNTDLQTWSGLAPVRPTETDEAARPPAAQPAKPAPRRVRRPSPAAPDADCKPYVETRRGEPSGEKLRLCFFANPGFRSEHVPEWALSNDDGLQMARVAIGRGSLTLIGTSALLGPRSFLRADDAQAFVDAVPLRRGDRLTILSASRAEPFVALLWRLAAPAMVLFGVAALLLILRHLPRFGPLAPLPVAARRSLAEQIRANARFAWRTGRLGSLRAAARRALDREAASRIAAYAALDAPARAALLGTRVGVDTRALTAALTDDAAAPAPVQHAAIALLEQTRRTLTMSSRHKGSA